VYFRYSRTGSMRWFSKANGD